MVACTQESRLFLELNEQTEGAPASPSGRSASSTSARPAAGRRTRRSAMPKIAALLAAAQLPEPEPVPTVSYRSPGRVLVIGAADAAERAAALLADKLDVSAAARSGRRRRCRRSARCPCIAGTHRRASPAGSARSRLTLDARQPDRPRPVHALQCLHRGLPRAGAIDFGYQIDLAQVHRPPRLRARLRAPPARSTSSARRRRSSERFDLVLDLRAEPRVRAARSRRRATSTPADDARAARRRAASCASWSASSRSRSSSTTGRSSARTAATSRSAATPASTSARPQAIRSDARQGDAAAASSSSRTCASAAAPAPRCARAAR